MLRVGFCFTRLGAAIAGQAGFVPSNLPNAICGLLSVYELRSGWLDKNRRGDVDQAARLQGLWPSLLLCEFARVCRVFVWQKRSFRLRGLVHPQDRRSPVRYDLDSAVVPELDHLEVFLVCDF